MIVTGLDQLLKKYRNLTSHKKLAVLCHPASINKTHQHILSVLMQAKLNLQHLLGPEHGIYGEAQDMEGVGFTQDQQTGLPVYSLYAHDENSLRPQEAWLKNIEVLLVDLQDVGARYYTFIYTMAFCMQVAAKTKTQIIVLDRPNPINGFNLEGNLILPGYESFVGAFSLPNRHGMTIGELALLFNEEWNIHCDLKIIPMKGWHRKRYMDEQGYPWVAPSPNMPTVDTAVLYPGMCLIEGTELSEGRGTTKPFELIGAPYIDPFQLAKHLNSFQLPCVTFRPTYFKPQFQKHVGKVCGGVQIHVLKRRHFNSLLTGMAVIKAIHDLYPKDFCWRSKAYEFVKDIPAIDLLMGSDVFRKQIESGTSLKEMQTGFAEDLEKFREIRRKYLIYKN